MFYDAGREAVTIKLYDPGFPFPDELLAVHAPLLIVASQNMPIVFILSVME